MIDNYLNINELEIINSIKNKKVKIDNNLIEQIILFRKTKILKYLLENNK